MMSGNQPGDNLEDSDPEFAIRLDIRQILRNILKTGQLHCSMVSKTMDPSWTSNSCEIKVAWSCNKLHLECSNHNALNIMLKVIICKEHQLLYTCQPRIFFGISGRLSDAKTRSLKFQAKRMEESKGKPIRICPKLYRSPLTKTMLRIVISKPEAGSELCHWTVWNWVMEQWI